MAGLDNISRTFNLTSQKRKRDRINHAPSGNRVLEALKAKAEEARRQQQIWLNSSMSAGTWDPQGAAQRDAEMAMGFHDANIAAAQWEHDQGQQQAKRRELAREARHIDDPIIAAMYRHDPKTANELLLHKRRAQANKEAAEFDVLGRASLSELGMLHANEELTNREKDYLRGIDSGSGSAQINPNAEIAAAQALEELKHKNKLELSDRRHKNRLDYAGSKKDLDLEEKQGRLDIDLSPETAQKEAANTAYKTWRKDFLDNVETNQKGLHTADNVLALFAESPGLAGTDLEEVIAHYKTRFGSASEADEKALQLKANLTDFVLPIAKTLGANPSNYDAKIIQASFGGSLGKAAILPKVFFKKAAGEVEQEDYEILRKIKNPLEFEDKLHELELSAPKRRIAKVLELARDPKWKNDRHVQTLIKRFSDPARAGKDLKIKDFKIPDSQANVENQYVPEEDILSLIEQYSPQR